MRKSERVNERAALIERGLVREGPKYYYREGVSREAVDKAMHVFETCESKTQALRSRVRELSVVNHRRAA